MVRVVRYGINTDAAIDLSIACNSIEMSTTKPTVTAATCPPAVHSVTIMQLREQEIIALISRSCVYGGRNRAAVGASRWRNGMQQSQTDDIEKCLHGSARADCSQPRTQYCTALMRVCIRSTSELCLRRSYVRSCWVYWLISHTCLLTRGGCGFRHFRSATRLRLGGFSLSGFGALSEIF